MKYPDRMARRGRGSCPFHTVFATTFSIEFAALEEIMLPQLMASGASNLLILADERMAAMSLSDGSALPMQLGRDYALHSPPVADGLFHPKILLQIGRRSGRLFVGSANITAAGLAGNAEAVIEIECQDEPGPEREVIRSAWRYVSSLIPEERGAARDALNWASDRASWLAGSSDSPLQNLDDGTAIAFLVRDGRTGIANRFAEIVAGERVDRLIVASPYWDEELAALKTLSGAFTPNSITILLDPDGHEFPLDAQLPKDSKFREFPRKLVGRFKHAKFVIASTATHDHVLVGSANCTTAAMGSQSSSGSNQEACIYRKLPRDGAIASLNLAECLDSEPVDLGETERLETASIPLAEISARKAGSFELSGETLTWTPPPRIAGSGWLILSDALGTELDRIAFDLAEGPSGACAFHLPFEKPTRVSFAVVEQSGIFSNRAHITHRDALRRRRREVASGSLAKAIAAFDAGEDFDLWLHSSFEELARADLADRPLPQIKSARPRQADKAEAEQPGRELCYEEFMELRAPDVRADHHRESAVSGTHSDSVRSFLNLLIGKSSGGPGLSQEDDDWLDLGDEGEYPEDGPDAEPDREPAKSAAPAEERRIDERTVNASLFEKMVRQYAENIAASDEPLGAADVLRVRFWLMMLLFKAKNPKLPNGLETSSEAQGWPRLAFRVIAAFFCGKPPPITRLMIAREYTEMPADFLECWATVLWALDAIEARLSGSARHRQFLEYVRKARAEVVRILGLTPGELASETIVETRAAMDRTIGSTLRFTASVAASPNRGQSPILRERSSRLNS